MKHRTALAIIVVALVVLLFSPSPLPPQIGAVDFRAYWSASYLLTRGENFADPQKLFEAERTRTDWKENYPMVTWNPPWLLAMLAPYAFVSFERAVWWWALTNIALAFASGVLLWHSSASRKTAATLPWVPMLMVFGFSMTLTAIAAGQVNLLVLAGLAGFLFFDSREREASAGAALALTMVKPQLVYLVIPILLLNFLFVRRWRALAGFLGLLVGLTAIVFVLHPSFLGEYTMTVGGGRLLDYQTPTLGGWLDMLFGWSWAKFLGLALVPLAMIMGWLHRANLETRTVLDVGLLVSVIAAPFLWSYDFVVLLVPLMSVVSWIADSKLPRLDSAAIVLALVAVNFMTFYQRATTEGEIYFFWVPLFAVGIYVFARWRVQTQFAYA